MTSEGIEDTVVVQVSHVASLHEHLAIVELVHFEIPSGTDAHEVNPIIASSGENVFDAIVVDVSNTGSPLVAVAHLSVMNGVKSRCCLVEDIDVFTLVKNDNVVQSVVVDIDEADGSSTVEGSIHQFGIEVEGLCR